GWRARSVPAQGLLEFGSILLWNGRAATIQTDVRRRAGRQASPARCRARATASRATARAAAAARAAGARAIACTGSARCGSTAARAIARAVIALDGYRCLDAFHLGFGAHLDTLRSRSLNRDTDVCGILVARERKPDVAFDALAGS